MNSLAVLYNSANNWLSLEAERALLNGKGMNKNLLSAELSTFSIVFLLGGFVDETMSLKQFCPFCGWILVLWWTCSDLLLCKEDVNNNIDLSSKKRIRCSVIAERLCELTLVLLGCSAPTNFTAFQTILCLVQLKCNFLLRQSGHQSHVHAAVPKRWLPFVLPAAGLGYTSWSCCLYREKKKKKLLLKSIWSEANFQ